MTQFGSDCVKKIWEISHLLLENVTILITTIYFCLSITVFQCYNDYWFSVTFRHILRFISSSGLRFFCFNPLHTSLSHLFPDLFLLSVNSCAVYYPIHVVQIRSTLTCHVLWQFIYKFLLHIIKSRKNCDSSLVHLIFRFV